MPVWLIFLLSAGAIIAAGARLSRDGDALAEHTGLGGAWIGAVLVAGATSLPELATDFYAVRAGQRNLAVGDLFGSCMANLLILAVADLMVRDVLVLSRVTVNQVLVGLLGIGLLVTAMVGIVAPVSANFLGAGWAAWVIGIAYLAGMRLLHVNRGEALFETDEQAHAHRVRVGGLRPAIVGFVVSAGVILFAAQFLAQSAAEIAGMLGLSGGFVGMVLLALTTSLPELTVSIAAVRSGSYDLAVGNLLGSNCFNMAVLLVLDVADGGGSLLAGLEPGLLIGALFAVLLTVQALLGVLNRSPARVWFLEPDAVFLLLTYAVGLFFCYRAEPGHAPAPPASPATVPPTLPGVPAGPSPRTQPAPGRRTGQGPRPAAVVPGRSRLPSAPTGSRTPAVAAPGRSGAAPTTRRGSLPLRDTPSPRDSR